jgi:hypothetical protein
MGTKTPTPKVPSILSWLALDFSNNSIIFAPLEVP